MKTYAIALLMLLITSCSSKMTVQKAVYKNGKIHPIGKAVAFRMAENDTINLLKRIR